MDPQEKGFFDETNTEISDHVPNLRFRPRLDPLISTRTRIPSSAEPDNARMMFSVRLSAHGLVSRDTLNVTVRLAFTGSAYGRLLIVQVYSKKPDDKRLEIITVLGIPSVTSPENAVKVGIAGLIRQQAGLS